MTGDIKELGVMQMRGEVPPEIISQTGSGSGFIATQYGLMPLVDSLLNLSRSDSEEYVQIRRHIDERLEEQHVVVILFRCGNHAHPIAVWDTQETSEEKAKELVDGYNTVYAMAGLLATALGLEDEDEAPPTIH